MPLHFHVHATIWSVRRSTQTLVPYAGRPNPLPTNMRAPRWQSAPRTLRRDLRKDPTARHSRSTVQAGDLHGKQPEVGILSGPHSGVLPDGALVQEQSQLLVPFRFAVQRS